MHYCRLQIGPRSREWLAVERGGRIVYSGPPETPAMERVFPPEACDDMLRIIDAHRRARDERARAAEALLQELDPRG